MLSGYEYDLTPYEKRLKRELAAAQARIKRLEAELASARVQGIREALDLVCAQVQVIDIQGRMPGLSPKRRGVTFCGFALKGKNQRTGSKMVSRGERLKAAIRALTPSDADAARQEKPRPDNRAICRTCGHFALDHSYPQGRCEFVETISGTPGRGIVDRERCHCELFVDKTSDAARERERKMWEPFEMLIQKWRNSQRRGYEVNADYWDGLRAGHSQSAWELEKAIAKAREGR